MLRRRYAFLMRRTYKIAPSILSANFACLGDEVRRVEAAGADLIHFDVMDGHFVPNLSFGIPVLESVRAVTHLPLDAHLMIEEPGRFLESFVKAGANSISVHVETCDDLVAIAARIHELGVRASVAKALSRRVSTSCERFGANSTGAGSTWTSRLTAASRSRMWQR